MNRVSENLRWLQCLWDLPVGAKFRFRHDLLMAICLLGILVTAPCIWSQASFTDKDEYWLTFRTPLEMIERDDWLTPWLNGEPRLSKPPLLYWAILGTYKLVGVNLTAARLWGVVFGAGMAVCCILISRELFGGSGLGSGLIALSTIGIAIQGRLAMLDLPLALFTSLGILSFLRWTRRGTWRDVLSSALFMGLSVLVKWPIGLLFFGAAALARLWIFRQWHIIISRFPQVMTACVIFLAVCLPWPLLMMTQWPDFWNVIGQEIASRHPGANPLSSLLPVLGGIFGLIFPWTPVLPAAMADGLKTSNSDSNRENRWLVIWILGSIIPLLFIRSFERYLTPLIPAACVLCACWLETHQGTLYLRLNKLVLWLTVGLAVLCCASFAWFKTGLPWVFVSVIPVAAMVRSALSSPDFRQTAGWVMVALVLLMGGLYPSIKSNALPNHLASSLGGMPVVVYGTSQPAMLSMNLKRSVIPVGAHSSAGHSLLQSFEGFVFMNQEDAVYFESMVSRSGIRFQRMGQFQVLISRGAKLGQEGAGWGCWKQCLEERSLKRLMTEVVYYRLSRKTFF